MSQMRSTWKFRICLTHVFVLQLKILMAYRGSMSICSKLLAASCAQQSAYNTAARSLKICFNLQILSTQHQLMLAKAEEDQVGQAAAHTRRWSSLRNIVEARSLLKALFQFAVSQKSQASLSQGSMTRQYSCCAAMDRN